MGYDEDLFWTLTPRRFIQYEKAFHQRQKADFEINSELMIYCAWVSGVVSSSSKTIKIEDLLPNMKPKPIDNEEALISQFKLLNAGLNTISLEEWESENLNQ